MRLAILLIAAGLCVGSEPASAEGRCLAYEPARVTLEGRLTSRTMPGPPDYRNIAKGDLPEKVLVLVLEEPVCVSADPSSRSNSQTHTRIGEVQLVGKTAPSRRLIDKRVRATGTLFASHSRAHRTAVVLTVQGLRAADAAP